VCGTCIVEVNCPQFPSFDLRCNICVLATCQKPHHANSPNAISEVMFLCGCHFLDPNAMINEHKIAKHLVG
jgi:hypothetical protein